MQHQLESVTHALTNEQNRSGDLQGEGYEESECIVATDVPSSCLRSFPWPFFSLPS